ncbi:MAG: hypothetical protein QOF41_1823 [Methylobacteriaceae bacterium]|nr:hypothetical protein [Methylobacteriaceae bacterium]
MTRTVFAPLACCIALLSAPALRAEPFGALSSWQKPALLAPNGSVADPAIANWLMRLPQSDGPSKPSTIGAAPSSELFDVTPIGGELYRFSPAAPANSPGSLAQADVARQLFDATFIGDEPGGFSSAVSQSRAVAQNAELRASVEGRSVSKAHRPAHRVVRAKVAAPRPVGRISRCTCAATGATVAKRTISD